MLYIRAKNLYRITAEDNAMTAPSATFALGCTDEWLDSEFARRMIEDVDGIKLTPGVSTRKCLLEHDMIPEYLANGTKNNLIARFFEPCGRIVLSMMGPNCYKYLCETAREKDVYAFACIAFTPTDEDLQGLQVYMEDYGVLCRNAAELKDYMFLALGEGKFHYEEV